MDFLLQSMVNQNYVHVLFEKVKKNREALISELLVTLIIISSN